jgi:hypothetical protein
MLNDIFFDQDFDIKKGVIEDEKSYIQSWRIWYKIAWIISIFQEIDKK